MPRPIPRYILQPISSSQLISLTGRVDLFPGRLVSGHSPQLFRVYSHSSNVVNLQILLCFLFFNSRHCFFLSTSLMAMPVQGRFIF